MIVDTPPTVQFRETSDGDLVVISFGSDLISDREYVRALYSGLSHAEARHQWGHETYVVFVRGLPVLRFARDYKPAWRILDLSAILTSNELIRRLKTLD